jgi:hypothetical protein
MTAKEGGNVVFAGSKKRPVHPDVAPCHPWHRDIPFILNIKKAVYLTPPF